MLKRSPLKGNTKLKKSTGLPKKQGGLKKTGKLKVKDKSKEQVKEGKKQQEMDWKFYQSIWDSRPHRSEISGIWLGSECKTVYMHHCLPKGMEAYEHLRYADDNILQCTWEEHSRIEAGWKPKILVDKIEQLKLKYGL